MWRWLPWGYWSYAIAGVFRKLVAILLPHLDNPQGTTVHQIMEGGGGETLGTPWPL